MDDLAALASRILGAILGAFLALVFLIPKSRRELIARGTFSVIVGFLAGPPIRVYYLHWDSDPQYRMAAASGVAMLSWFVMEAAVRILRVWMPREKETE